MLGHGMITSATKLQYYWKTVRAAPFQAASRTIPTHFRDLFARPFQAPSKTLPTPFQELFAPAQGSGLAGWKPENSSAVSEDRTDTSGTRSLTLAKSRKRIARSGARLAGAAAVPARSGRE